MCIKHEIQHYYKEIGSITGQKDESLEQKKRTFKTLLTNSVNFFSADDLKNAMDTLEIVGEELDDVTREHRVDQIPVKVARAPA